jgi:hypothetical protein
MQELQIRLRFCHALRKIAPASTLSVFIILLFISSGIQRYEQGCSADQCHPDTLLPETDPAEATVVFSDLTLNFDTLVSPSSLNYVGYTATSATARSHAAGSAPHTRSVQQSRSEISPPTHVTNATTYSASAIACLDNVGTTSGSAVEVDGVHGPWSCPISRFEAHANTPKTLIIIDSSIYDAQLFVKAAAAGAEVLLLDGNHSGVQFVADHLANVSRAHPAGVYGVVAIVSGGGPGLIRLGQDVLSLHTMAAHTAALENWSKGLTFGADLHLLGCSVASTADGRIFVDTLGRVLHSNVAASDDLTNASDWLLEYSSGVVLSKLPFDLPTLSSYPSSLEILVDIGFTTMNMGTPQLLVGNGYSTGSVYIYKSIATRDGVSVDALYTLTDVSNLGTYTADANTNVPWFEPSQAYSAAGYVDYTFEFFLADTNTPIYLTNFCKSNRDIVAAPPQCVHPCYADLCALAILSVLQTCLDWTLTEHRRAAGSILKSGDTLRIVSTLQRKLHCSRVPMDAYASWGAGTTLLPRAFPLKILPA